MCAKRSPRGRRRKSPVQLETPETPELATTVPRKERTRRGRSNEAQAKALAPIMGADVTGAVSGEVEMPVATRPAPKTSSLPAVMLSPALFSAIDTATGLAETRQDLAAVDLETVTGLDETRQDLAAVDLETVTGLDETRQDLAAVDLEIATGLDETRQDLAADLGIATDLASHAASEAPAERSSQDLAEAPAEPRLGLEPHDLLAAAAAPLALPDAPPPRPLSNRGAPAFTDLPRLESPRRSSRRRSSPTIHPQDAPLAPTPAPTNPLAATPAADIPTPLPTEQRAATPPAAYTPPRPAPPKATAKPAPRKRKTSRQWAPALGVTALAFSLVLVADRPGADQPHTPRARTAADSRTQTPAPGASARSTHQPLLAAHDGPREGQPGPSSLKAAPTPAGSTGATVTAAYLAGGSTDEALLAPTAPALANGPQGALSAHTQVGPTAPNNPTADPTDPAQAALSAPQVGPTPNNPTAGPTDPAQEALSAPQVGPTDNNTQTAGPTDEAQSALHAPQVAGPTDHGLAASPQPASPAHSPASPTDGAIVASKAEAPLTTASTSPEPPAQPTPYRATPAPTNHTLAHARAHARTERVAESYARAERPNPTATASGDDPARRYDHVPPKAAAATAALRQPPRPVNHDHVPPKAAAVSTQVRSREQLMKSAPLRGAPRLYLHTEPAGAEVWLLGQYRGTSPLSIELDGPAVVTLRHPGHEPRHVKVSPADDVRWLSVPLAPR